MTSPIGPSSPCGDPLAECAARPDAPRGLGEKADALLAARGVPARAVALARLVRARHAREDRPGLARGARESGKSQGFRLPTFGTYRIRKPLRGAGNAVRFAVPSEFCVVFGGTSSKSYGPRVQARAIRTEFTNNRNNYQKPV